MTFQRSNCMDQTGKIVAELPWRILGHVGAIRCDPAPTAVRSNSKDDSLVRRGRDHLLRCDCASRSGEGCPWLSAEGTQNPRAASSTRWIPSGIYKPLTTPQLNSASNIPKTSRISSTSLRTIFGIESLDPLFWSDQDSLADRSCVRYTYRSTFLPNLTIYLSSEPQVFITTTHSQWYFSAQPLALRAPRPPSSQLVLDHG